MWESKCRKAKAASALQNNEVDFNVGEGYQIAEV